MMTYKVGRRMAVMLALVLFGVMGPRVKGSAQSRANEFAGTWAGTWDGSGSGAFELTLDTKDGKPAGKVAVTTDGGNYTADLKGLVFDGTRMTAAYDFPLDPSSEVALAATFDARTAKGTWSLHPKGQTTEIAGGTWTVTRK